MHADLEKIVSADEEARSRVTLAERHRERELAAERAARDAAVDARRREAQEALESELRVIREEGDARVAELREQQKQYRTVLATAAEHRIGEAVALYRRIVCEVAA